MKKMREMYLKLCIKGQMSFNELKNDETGAFGVKEIAATLAIVVVIAAIGTFISGNDTLLGEWIDDVWDFMTEALADMF